MNTWIVTLEEDPETNDLILPFPQDMLDQLGWQTDDVLDFQLSENSSSATIVNVSLAKRNLISNTE